MAFSENDFSKVAIDDFEKIKASKITWIEVAEKLKNPSYYAQYVKLLEDEAVQRGLNKEVHIQSSLNFLELSSSQAKSSLSPSNLIEIYNDIKNRNPDFNIDVPEDIYFKEIALQDFNKVKAAKITWVEVAEKLNNPFYKESFVQLLQKEAYDNNLNKDDYVNSSIEQYENIISQTVNSLNKDQLKELYSDIISRNPDFNIKLPEKAFSQIDKLNFDLESIEKDNPKYIEAKEDLAKHINNKISDPEIAEKLNSDLEYKIAFTRYLEKDFYDKKRIGIDAKTYAEQRIASINMSLLYDHKEVKDQEGFYAQEKASKVDDDWIDIQKKSVNNDESNPILDILNKMKATPSSNGEVVYSLDGNYAFTDKGQSIQFSSNSPSDDEIIAAILLAKEKYHNSFALTGPQEYQDRVMKIMIDNNITINFLNKDQANKFEEMKEKISNKTTNNSNNIDNEANFSDEKSEQPSFDTVDSDRGELNMDQQNNTAANVDQQNTDAANNQHENKKLLAVRGVVRNEDGSFTNTVLLWKDENEKNLSGKITTPDGVVHQVKADIIPRTDGKANFLAIKVRSPQEGEGKPPYVDWGYANAVNSRKDNKAVYFDEIVFNLQKLKQYEGLILKARVTDKVPEQLHKDLGFIDKKQIRPKFEETAKNEAKNEAKTDNHENASPENSTKARKTRRASA